MNCYDDNFNEILCSNTSVAGDNVLSAIIIDLILGVLCWIGFVLWRGYFPVYRGREILPGVRHRPPKLSLKGHRRYWNWMLPTFKISDAEFLKSAGLDALIAVRVLSYGLALFLPVGVFGIAILLPVNYTSNGLKEEGQAPENATNGNLTYFFLRLTISNIPNGSNLMWIHFVFMFAAIGYGCLLIVLFYEENISLQHTLLSNYITNVENGTEFEEVAGDFDEDGDQSSKSGHKVHRLLGAPDIELEEEQQRELERYASNLEAGTVNQRVLKMLDEENNSLLAQAFRETIQKPQPGKLWPVLRPRPYTSRRPEFAGKYAVLVIDEPRKKFRRAAIAGRRSSRSGEPAQSTGLWKSLWSLFNRKEDNSQRSMMLSPESSDAVEVGPSSEATGTQVHHSAAGTVKRTPKTRCCGLVKQSQESLEKEVNDRSERFTFIEATFKRLFGDDFDSIVPVYNTEKLDAIIMRRYDIQAKIVRIEYQISRVQNGKMQNEEKKQKKLDKLQSNLDTLRDKDEALGQLIAEEKERIQSNPACASFIAVFHSAMAAQAASNINANPVSWRGFHTMPCPDPENINYPAVTTSSGWRAFRAPVSLFFIILVMIFPLSIFTGAFSQLDSAICGAPANATASASDDWICSDDFWAKLIMSVLTGILPQLLLTVYQSVFVPIYVMFCSQSERRHYSLSRLDLRCAQLFFHWNVWNFFFGSLLGGTVLSGLREAINDPGAIVNILGTAIPSASNFFINYVILRALTMTMFRLFYPHACVGMNIAQWFFVMPRPKTPMDFARSHPLRNCRFSRDLSISVLTIFVASSTYCVISPFILIWTMIYFMVMYMVWRYQQLYVYQSTYRSFGQMWTFYAHRLVAVFALTVLFTGVMFLIKRAYVQGGIAIIVGELLLLAFNKYVTNKYDSIVQDFPVALLEAMPTANLDLQQFMPPSMRDNEDGWFMEHGKAWIFWGAPRYGY